jgi:hypothetical protein
MNAVRLKLQSNTQFPRGTTPVESQTGWPQIGSQFLPADSATATDIDALIQEFLTRLGRDRGVEDELAGWRSESQGE